MPRIQYDIIRNKRLEVIRRLQTRRKSRVLLLVHRQEQFLFFGIPIMRFINIEDSEEILREIRNTPKDMPIDLIIHTRGITAGRHTNSQGFKKSSGENHGYNTPLRHEWGHIDSIGGR